MDILDRLLGHDAWTTRQLLEQCQQLSNADLDKPFAIDHHTLRQTILHMVSNLESWTDLLYERPVQQHTGPETETIAALLDRLGLASRDFSILAKRIAREQRADDGFLDVLDDPPKYKTFGGTIAHVITHNMHHRAQIMTLMEQLGLPDHIEGDVLGWESLTFGWG